MANTVGCQALNLARKGSVAMLALIGSHALRHYTDIGRTPKDIDLIGTYNDVMDFVSNVGPVKACYPIQGGAKYVVKTEQDIIEAEIAWPGSLAERLLAHISVETPANYLAIPSLDVLYTLKMSHRYLKNSPHFLKTMRDIHLMRSFGAKVHDPVFLKDREKETYAYNHPKLNTTKDNFFTGDGVRYVYDHDTIHLAVAHLGKPAYRFYQPETSQVNVARSMFFAQPDEIRLYGVLEESYVLALERSHIPYGARVAPKKSFDMALMKVCTSITSGWFREYAWEHYDRVQALYDERYVGRFWGAVSSGAVKPYKGES